MIRIDSKFCSRHQQHRKMKNTFILRCSAVGSIFFFTRTRNLLTTVFFSMFLLSAVLTQASDDRTDVLRQAAHNGDPASQLKLADEFFFGRNRQINPAIAVYWYRKSAENGLPQAQYNLGACLENGWGCKKSKIKAFDWYKKAAEQNLSRAVIRYAELLFYGVPDEEDGKYKLPGIPPAPEKAVALLRSRSNDPAAWKSLAVILMQNRNTIKQHGREIRSLLEKAVSLKRSDPELLLLLAEVYQNGTGGVSDQKRSAFLLEKAASLKHPEGMVRYGLLLEFGHARKPDPQAAIEFYRKAAQANSARGMYELARNLKNGIYIRQDLAESFRLFKKSAERGYPPAFASAGDCLRYGFGTEISESSAFEYYMRGANLSDPECQMKLGECCRDGIGVPRDPSGALYWFRKAAQANHPEALRHLAIAMLTGNGVKKDPVSGTQLLKQAAALGDQEAQKLLISGGN